MATVKKAQLFETKPRWLGAPKICIAANLPAFDSPADWEKFHAANSPGNSVKRMWQCEACGKWHVWTVACDPSGASSGTGRSSK